MKKTVSRTRSGAPSRDSSSRARYATGQVWRFSSKTVVATKVAIFGNFGGDLDKKSGNTDQIKTITVSAKFQASAVPLELQAKYRFYFDFSENPTFKRNS